MGRIDDEDEATLDGEVAPALAPPPRAPSAARSAPPGALTTRPIPRSQAPDFDDDGDFEGDDPPTTAEPMRDDHHPEIAPRSPSIPTRPVPKFRGGDSGEFDDDANPTMIDPHVPTGGAPRASFDPYARIDDHRRTNDIAAAQRAMDPTADLGPAARRAFADAGAPDPRRDAMPTAPIRKPIHDPLSTAPMGSGATTASSAAPSAPPRRNPPGPTGPMLRPPPDAPPALAGTASGAQRPVAPAPPSSPRPGRASGPARAIAPSPPPPFVADRRAAMSGQPAELARTIQDPPYDGGPASLRSFGPPPGAAPTAPPPGAGFDPRARIDDSSRTQRWEGRPAPDPYAATATHASQPQPIHAISHKTDSAVRPAYEQRPVPQVQLRSMAELSKTPAQGMGRLAPPHDPNRARSRKAQDVLIWGSVVVIIGSIVTLVIWLIAR